MLDVKEKTNEKNGGGRNAFLQSGLRTQNGGA
jgi:hypothetical protein